MVNPEHVAILNQGVDIWNKWRTENPQINPDLQRAALGGANLKGAYLSGVKLRKAFLSGARLGGADLRKADLSGARLNRADLIDANLNGADLSGADLSDAKLGGADLSETKLSGADLYRADLSETKLLRSDLSGAKMSEAKLLRSDLSGANLEGAHLYRVDLSRAKLSRANLYRSDLSGADLYGANLEGANLYRVDLSGADLSEANLSGSRLSGSKLEGTNLSRANLSGSNLSGSKLEDANLEGVSLKNVVLKGFNLSGIHLNMVDLTDSDLRNCNLIDAELDGSNLTGAKLWETNRFGWSIKGVTCEYAYFNREGNEKTEFVPGEFERLYSEKTRILLRYKDGMTSVEVMTLPALIKIIENENPGSSLRLESIKEDAGGVSVSIVVEELARHDLMKLKSEAEQLKNLLRENQLLLSQAEGKYLGLKQFMLEGWRENMGKYTINGDVHGPVGDGGSISMQVINKNDIDIILKLINEIEAARLEILKAISSENAVEFDAAFKVIQEQVATRKEPSTLKKALGSAKDILQTGGDIAGKWIPILERLSEVAHQAGLI